MVYSKRTGVVFLLIFACGVVHADVPVRSFGKEGSISHYFPPPRLTPEQMPTFQRGEARLNPGRLDDNIWIFADSLTDNRVEPEAVVPTGILFFPSVTRGLISSFHTIFRTDDGGAHWRDANMGSAYHLVWHPFFIYGMSANSSVPSQMTDEMVYIAYMNAESIYGFVNRVYFPNPGYTSEMDGIALLIKPFWLGHVALSDTGHLAVLGSWDGYGQYGRARYDTGSSSLRWDWEEEDLVIDPGGWVTGSMACIGGFVYAVGARQWVSQDSGRTWEIRPSADGVFDGGVCFVDTLYGWTGGGRIQPTTQGWVHRTTDGGLTWSGRILETDYPIRAVYFITRDIGFAAGGNYEAGIGGIWSTRDGGDTWQEDATVSAELTVIGSRRDNPAYVDVFAAGFYPDFIGGVWKTRIFLPDTGAVLVARPDTLDFGSILPGETDTLSFWTANFGSRVITVTELTHANQAFMPLPDVTPFDIAIGDSVEVPVIFQPDDIGNFSDVIRIYNNEDLNVRVACRGVGLDVAADDSGLLLPEKPTLSIYPNPGNPAFNITFSLPAKERIQLVVYNLLGHLIAIPANGFYDAGIHHVIWSGENLPSGIYFVRLEGIPSPQTQKLFLMK